METFHANRKITLKHLLSHLLYDGHAHVVEVVEPDSVGQKCVPQSHTVRHIKVLRHEQHYPAQGVKLWVDPLLLQFIINRLVYKLKHPKQARALTVDAAPLFI